MRPEDKLHERLKTLIADGGKPGCNRHEWANSVVNVAQQLLPPGDSRLKHLDFAMKQLGLGVDPDAAVRSIGGLARALDADLTAGVLGDLHNQIRRDVESDFLGQAAHLLDEGLKDPAAMLTGAVLEDSLRQLCRKHGVAEGKNIESMNAPLLKAGVYDSAQQKQVTAWAAIRNDADHGHFDRYDLGRVKLMRDGVLEFVVRLLR